MEKWKQDFVDRKAMKIAVEEFALRSAPVPPCTISALAVAKEGLEDSSVYIYLGTNTGYVLLYVWKQAPASTSQSTFCRLRPLRSSGNSMPSTPPRHSVSLSNEEVISGSQSSVSDLEYQNGLESVELKSNVAASPERQRAELKLSTHRSLGRLSVEFLCVLQNVCQLAVLIDGQVVLLDSVTLGLLGRIPNCKGVTAVARGFGFGEWPSTIPGGKSDERAHLAVGMKTKILLFEVLSWQQEKENRASSLSGTNLSVIKEVTGVEGVLALAWVKNSLFIGTQSEYLLVSLPGGRATPLFSFPVDSPWRPMLKTFPKESQVLLVMDIAGILVNTKGHPVAGSLVFSGIPNAVGQSSPYAVVVNQGVVELFELKTGSKVQSLAFGAAPMGPSLVEDDNETLVVIGKGDKVSCLVQVTVDDQLKELLKQKEYSEAVKFAEECCTASNSEDSRTRLAIAHAEAGFLLLSDLRFEEAVNHFLQSELFEPTELLPLFPSLSMRWRSLVPRKRYWGLHQPPQALRTVIENGLSSLNSMKVKEPQMTDASSRSVLFNQCLLKAMKSFIRYWESTRERDLNSSVKEAIDTVLLKLYIEVGDSQKLETLVSSSNFCLLEEVGSLLRVSGQLRALALLYESKNMLESALQIWRQLAQSGSPSLSLEATSQAARLLETCSDMETVLQHFDWVNDLDEGMALRVLTCKKREINLPADEVLKKLTLDSFIRQRYLQWLVNDQGVQEPHIHTALALSLANLALKTESSDSSTTRQTLQEFLRASSKYDVGDVLDLIKNTCLWREQAILHMKLGNEALALEILALKLEDRDAAEEYCRQLGRPDAYMQLLRIYLANEGNVDHAIRLLHRHGSELDPNEVLEALPKTMPLYQASQALTTMLRAHTHARRELQIAENLAKAVNFQCHLERMAERSRSIEITSDTVCSSCKARIGTKLFAVYPNNSILCYKCLRLRGDNNGSQ